MHSYKAGHVTSSTSGQDSGAKHCIVKQCIWAVHPAQSTGWHGSTVQQVDNAMVVNEPAKPVAGSSQHPDDMDIIDGELIY